MLSGIRIVEVEALGPAPFAGMLLSDLGADVIVVQRRQAAATPGVPDRSVLDRGKRAIALDLKQPDDIAVLLDLVKSVDVLIEGFRPGVMERLGIGPEVCHAENPALVFGRMTGWGQHGELAQTAGHDLNYIALSGALWYGGAADAPPLTPPTLVGDIGGGALYLTVGILAGVLKARSTGQGCVVDAAILDGSAHMMNLLMALRQGGGMVTERGQSLLDGPHWSRTYQTKDGGYFSVQCLEPKFYAIFLDKLGLGDDPDFAQQFDKSRWPALSARLARLFATRSRDEWEKLFRGSDACTAPVLSPDEAMLHPMNGARHIWRRDNDVMQAAPAPRFSDQPPWHPKPSPRRGEHTDEILAELGHRGLRRD